MAKKSVTSRAKELLKFVREVAKTPDITWVEANNAIYGPSGRFTQLFSNEKERLAFATTRECELVDEAIDALPEPAVQPQRNEYSGKFLVRLPKSLHAALGQEAEHEGVSLNQLVVTKLAVHLASVRR